jgi:hypothetical protein
MKRHKGWSAVRAPGAPLRGPDILKLRICVPTGRLPSRPFVWGGIELSEFSATITRERRVKPPGPDLTVGGISPSLILWRCTYPGWLSPPNSDSCSTQILTRHYSAQSQTISQLASSGTTPTCNSPQLSHSRLTKHLRMGSM